ncbi:uncharacterized protein LOC123684404 [Harmonia axyridis]|uniref:uncharacterized protein LOC123684404 n=1 Tax=Harmonia axyridis TaxID=115357 RepID=UPI001E2755E2|nr:uncharacterized protein LOC123684404 [Harmonia axyridis]
MRANKIAGCLNDTIWRNKHLNIKTKAKIYKSIIRPNMNYTAETRPDTSKRRRMLETAEMNILRRISGKILYDRKRSNDIRKLCEVKKIGEGIDNRKEEWKEWAKARDKSPLEKRSIGRPRKRWSDKLRTE